MEQRNLGILGAIILIAVAGGVYFITRHRVPTGGSANLSSSTSSTAVPTSTIPATAASTTKRSITSSPPAAPTLSPVKGSANPPSPPDAVQASLWIGSSYKQAGNYAGAERAWLKTTLKWPNDPTAYNNLGDLYLAYLKDYPKAEASYRSVIRLDPHDVNAYRTLLGLYTATPYHPSPTAAEDILKQGIATNPKAIDLQVLLARYYRDSGRIAEAKVEYDTAIANARAQGQIDIAAQIQQEKAGQ